MPWSQSLAACLLLVVLVPAQVPLFQALDNSLPVDVEASGDLDADGDVDLLIPGGVLLNDGHGRFTRTPIPTLAFVRVRSKLADLNGDGFADLITRVNAPIPDLQVYMSFGLAFGLSQSLSLGSPGSTLFPADFAPGDVDGDGDVDLLMGVWSISPFGSTSAPAILWLNNGAGILSQAPTASLPSGPLPPLVVKLRDLDADGDLDAVFADTTLSPQPGVLTATNVGGVFTLAAAPVFAAPFLTFEIGNFNNDALPDFVVALAGSAAVVLNSPAGFLPGVVSPRPVTPEGYAASDLNGDGIDEILEASYPNLVTVNLISPGGAFGATTQTWTDLRINNWMVEPLVRDLDGDGDRDVLALRYGEALTLMNAGNGSLVRIGGLVTNVAFSVTSIAHHVGDLDADGDPDVLGIPDGGFVLATGLNDGDGFFGAGPSSPTSPTSFYVNFPFDRDGDGDLDLYGAFQSGGAPGPQGPDAIFDNVGASFTQIGTVPSTGDARGFQSADFDGDGDQDLVMGRWIISSTPAGPMTYVANLGAAGLAAPVSIGTAHHNYDLDLADFDGNGTLDVFQTNAQTFTSGPDTCVVYLNSGTGSFTPVTVTGVSGHFAAAGDLNGDGMADVVVDGQVRFSAGAGTFIPGPPLPSALVGPAALVDVDLDGDLDLVETPATLMLNAGGGTFGAPVSFLPRIPTGVHYTEIPQSAVVDVDRDGDPDIVAQGPLVLINTTRQLARGSIPRPNRPGSVDLYGTPGGAWFLFASSGTTAFQFPPWGNVLIDPASAQLGAMGTFAGPTAAQPGTASFGVTLPNNPALVGWTTYWQAIEATQMRFTNRLTITVMGY